MNQSSWMNDPALKQIDPVKLQLLSSLANEAGTKGPNDMLPFFLSAMNRTNAGGSGFSDNERELLLNVMMQKLSPEEKQKAETILRMTSAFQKTPPASKPESE